MEERQEMWGKALAVARTFLCRWSDPFTRDRRDDLAQEAVLAYWRYAKTRPSDLPMGPVVRTISRRLRSKALEASARAGAAVAEVAAGDGLGAVRRVDEPRTNLRVDGALVPADWLLAQLGAVLARMRPLNRRVVLGYYEGFSCLELADRLDLSEEVVKVRLYRSRRMLRKRLEAMTRAAGHFEP